MTVYQRLAPEQHDSLPDIPEPSERTRLVGHGEVARRILASHRHGRLHHGLLLHGPRGIGKATFAFQLAHFLLAGEGDATFGNVDPGASLYRQIAGGTHPAVLHLTRPLDREGKKFRTAITVEEVRRVGNLLSRTAHDGGYRIVIVDPAEDMNASAANALLKSLEEPPRNCLFILVSHRPGSLLPTIRSRCQAYRFDRLSDGELAGILQELGEEAVDALVQRSAGSVRDAILLTRNGGLELGAAVEEIAAASAFDVEKAYRLAEAATGRGSEMQFSIVNEEILDRIAAAAREAALSGDSERAGRMAALWSDLSRTTAQTEGFNLDRKQHIVSMLQRLRAGLG